MIPQRNSFSKQTSHILEYAKLKQSQQSNRAKRSPYPGLAFRIRCRYLPSLSRVVIVVLDPVIVEVTRFVDLTNAEIIATVLSLPIA